VYNRREAEKVVGEALQPFSRESYVLAMKAFKGAVSSAIVRAIRPSQVVENVQASEVELSNDVLDEIETILKEIASSESSCGIVFAKNVFSPDYLQLTRNMRKNRKTVTAFQKSLMKRRRSVPSRRFTTIIRSKRFGHW
jgi:hypothetical protein